MNELISVKSVKTEEVSNNDLADELVMQADRIRSGEYSAVAITLIGRTLEDKLIVQGLSVGQRQFQPNPDLCTQETIEIEGMQTDELTSAYSAFANSIDIFCEDDPVLNEFALKLSIGTFVEHWERLQIIGEDKS